MSAAVFAQPLRLLCDTLVIESPRTRSDLIVVLGGRYERHLFALQLWRDGLAPRLLLSIGRFDARLVTPSLPDSEKFQALVRDTTPPQRHFFGDLTRDNSQYSVARFSPRGTYPELLALACYLESRPASAITVVSTSIHLRRIRYCCRRIPFYQARSIYYAPVPEETSSFRQRGWWKHLSHWSYIAQEYGKLLLYSIVYPGARPPT